MVPFGDCPTPRPAVDYQDWGGGGFGSMQDGDGQMAVVPWVLVACQLELGGTVSVGHSTDWRPEVSVVGGSVLQVVVKSVAKAIMTPIAAPGRCIVCTVPIGRSVSGALPPWFEVW